MWKYKGLIHCFSYRPGHSNSLLVVVHFFIASLEKLTTLGQCANVPFPKPEREESDGDVILHKQCGAGFRLYGAFRFVPHATSRALSSHSHSVSNHASLGN